MKIVKKIIYILDQISIIILNRLFCIFKLQTNKVLFISEVREKLGGNLECLYNVIPEEKYVKVISTKMDRRVRRSLKDKIKLIYDMSTAKYIFLEDYTRVTSYMKVRKNQEVIQLWHGPGAFKRFGHSRLRDNGDVKKVHAGYKRYTKATTSSEDIRECYAEAFNISMDKVKATGFPRTDMFFDEKIIGSKKEELYQKYPFLKGKKVILFAPTYRGKKVEEANYDFTKLNLDKIYKEFKDEYVFVFKWHPALYNNIVFKNVEGYDLSKYKDFYHELSSEREINDLLLVTDILITDYSSVIFDYVFMQKPIIYFTYDLEEYKNGRGWYFPFDEYVYGKVVKTDDELIKAIKLQDMEDAKREKFVNKFLGACDGKSTEKTYNWIFENE